MKTTIFAFLLGVLFIISIGSTQQVQQVIFKPSKPTSVLVKTYWGDLDGVSGFAMKYTASGYIIKSASISNFTTSSVQCLFVFEKY